MRNEELFRMGENPLYDKVTDGMIETANDYFSNDQILDDDYIGEWVDEIFVRYANKIYERMVELGIEDINDERLEPIWNAAEREFENLKRDVREGRILRGGRRGRMLTESEEDFDREKVEEIMEGIMEDESNKDVGSWDRLLDETESALEEAGIEVPFEDLQRLASDFWFDDYDRALEAWSRSLPENMKPVEVDQWAVPHLVNGTWDEHLAYYGKEAIGDFESLDEQMKEEGVSDACGIPFEFEENVDGRCPFENSYDAVNIAMYKGEWEPLTKLFASEIEELLGEEGSEEE